MKRIVLSLIIIAALSPAILQATEKLKILSTIKPVHSLVSAVLGDLALTEQIIPNHASAHHYSLKPSDIRRINNADLIFRIDPNLESFLTKSLRSIAADKVISLARTNNLTLHRALDSHNHPDKQTEKSLDHSPQLHEDDHKHETHSTEGAEHEEDQQEAMEALDYHLWLNPNNATAMTNTILEALTKLLPEHKEQLIKNTNQLLDNISRKDQEITQQLESVKGTPFLVMHDAWQYFTRHYQLKQLGSISAQERLKPSARALSDARKTLTKSNVHCLLTEPNLKPKTLRVLTENLAVNVTEIDPLGREIPDSSLAYPQLLQYTADKLLSCLQNK